jgi:hypothetical protein
VVVDGVSLEVEVGSVLELVVEEVVEDFLEEGVEALRLEDEVHREGADLGEGEARFGIVCEVLHLAFGSFVQNHSYDIGHPIKLKDVVRGFCS